MYDPEKEDLFLRGGLFLESYVGTHIFIQDMIINTSYRKLPFGSGDYPDKTLTNE